MLKHLLRLALANLLVFVSIVGCLAQKNFVPGYIISSPSDTLQGLIDNQNWNKNPKEINFKRSDSAPVERLSFRQLHGFGLASGEHYVREAVKIDKSSTSLDKLSNQQEIELVPDTVFLRMWVRGPVSLYYLKDELSKEHFLIQKQGQQAEELLLRKVVQEQNGRSYTGLQEIYKGQLQTALADCASLQKAIGIVKFEHKALQRLVQEYNACVGGGRSEVVQEVERPRYRIGIVAGGSRTNLSFNANPSLKIAGADFQPGLNYMIGVAVHTILPRDRGRWSVYNELSWRPFRVKGAYIPQDNSNLFDRERRYTFDIAYIGLTNMIRFSWPTSPVRPFVSTGLAFNFAAKVNENTEEAITRYGASQTSSSFHPGVLDFRRQEMALVVGTGATSSRFSGEIRGELGSGMTMSFEKFRPQKTMWLLLLGYYFN